MDIISRLIPTGHEVRNCSSGYAEDELHRSCRGPQPELPTYLIECGAGAADFSVSLRAIGFPPQHDCDAKGSHLFLGEEI